MLHDSLRTPLMLMCPEFCIIIICVDSFPICWSIHSTMSLPCTLVPSAPFYFCFALPGFSPVTSLFFSPGLPFLWRPAELFDMLSRITLTCCPYSRDPLREGLAYLPLIVASLPFTVAFPTLHCGATSALFQLRNGHPFTPSCGDMFSLFD